MARRFRGKAWRWASVIHVLTLFVAGVASDDSTPVGSAGCRSWKARSAQHQTASLQYLQVPDPAAGPTGAANRSYWIALPPTASDAPPATPATPATLVLMLHGWVDMSGFPSHDAAEDEMKNDNLTAFVAKHALNVVSVFPVGSGAGETGTGTSDEGSTSSGSIYAWNAPGNGLNTRPGPKGRTCKTPRQPSVQYPCFESCTRKGGGGGGGGGSGCSAVDGCNFASCLDDLGFIRLLLAELLQTYCIDTRHVHVAGFSTGGVMAYELGASVPGIASVAAVEAGQMLGFGSAPTLPVHLLDVHGNQDATMPANYSCVRLLHPPNHTLFARCTHNPACPAAYTCSVPHARR